MAGEGSAQGVRVVLDLNGGAAIGHAPEILRALGCEVLTIGDLPGTFSRKVDPTNDPLDLLCKTVKREEADAGFAFDSDGDRLVLVDSDGKKRTGDYMLSLAFKEMLQGQEEKEVVVSVDTSQAVDDVLEELGGKVYRAKVGESNVVGTMVEKGVRLGGEGSSAGLIDASFNYCRDSLLAATTIVAALKRKGAKKLYGEVRSYHQARLKVEVPRKKALQAMKRLQKELKEADTLDGLKVRTSKSSWVLLRVSNTEEGVRVSAEAPTAKEAERLAKLYVGRVRRAGA
jgi:phosphomannomutase